MKNLAWFFFIFFAIGVGLYPILYFLVGENVGLLTQKSAQLLESQIWWAAFYTHVSFGGIALLIGWSQFSKKIRDKKIKLHRTLGKIYLIAVMLAGVAGFYLAIHSEGGVIANFGFGGMALCWLTTSTLAYLSIRKREIDQHRAWMIRSYSLAFAAVTLRLYLQHLRFSSEWDLMKPILSLPGCAGFQICLWLSILLERSNSFRRNATLSEVRVEKVNSCFT